MKLTWASVRECPPSFVRPREGYELDQPTSASRWATSVKLAIPETAQKEA